MREDKKGELLILVIGIFIIILVLSSIWDVGLSESVYVICNPESFVYIRTQPKFKSQEVAYVYAGEELETDWKKNGQWTYVYYQCEAMGGWIFTGYLSESEPTIYSEGIPAVVNRGKTIVRRYARGPVKKKLKRGAVLNAFVVSDDWTITNAGFIKTELLSFEEVPND